MYQLIPGICEKLEFRGRPCEGLQLAIAGKEARLRPLWTRRLAYQMTSLPRLNRSSGHCAGHYGKRTCREYAREWRPLINASTAF